MISSDRAGGGLTTGVDRLDEDSCKVKARTRQAGGGSNEGRLALANEAAKLIAESGFESFAAARRKLAERYNIRIQSTLPKDDEIDDALRRYQRLFRSSSQPQALTALRIAAVEAMRALQSFRPRLVGPVLDGSADEGTPISLHVYSDDAESVLHFLSERGIPYVSKSQRLRLGPTHAIECPLLTFANVSASFRLTVVPLAASHQDPRGTQAEAPMRRASLDEVQRLLSENS
ncbi:MAG: hypothetical protein ACT4NL_18005 [Pseudomarimonas sp.]